MVLERLIDKILRTAIEHAGVQRGLLIVPRGDELRIEAEAMTAGEEGLASAYRSVSRSSKHMAVAFRRQRTHPMARCSFFRCRSANRPRRYAQ
jgi:hypothetical protein